MESLWRDCCCLGVAVCARAASPRALHTLGFGCSKMRMRWWRNARRTAHWGGRSGEGERGEGRCLCVEENSEGAEPRAPVGGARGPGSSRGWGRLPGPHTTTASEADGDGGGDVPPSGADDGVEGASGPPSWGSAWGPCGGCGESGRGPSKDTETRSARPTRRVGAVLHSGGRTAIVPAEIRTHGVEQKALRAQRGACVRLVSTLGGAPTATAVFGRRFVRHTVGVNVRLAVATSEGGMGAGRSGPGPGCGMSVSDSHRQKPPRVPWGGPVDWSGGVGALASVMGGPIDGLVPGPVWGVYGEGCEREGLSVGSCRGVYGAAVYRRWGVGVGRGGVACWGDHSGTVGTDSWGVFSVWCVGVVAVLQGLCGVRGVRRGVVTMRLRERVRDRDVVRYRCCGAYGERRSMTSSLRVSDWAVVAVLPTGDTEGGATNPPDMTVRMWSSPN